MLIRLCWVTIALAIVSGCRYRQDPTIDLLQGELRWMEDQLYMLEGELEQSCYELCDCRRALGKSRPQSQQNVPTPADSQPQPPTRSYDPPPAQIHFPESTPEMIPAPTVSEPIETPTIVDGPPIIEQDIIVDPTPQYDDVMQLPTGEVTDDDNSTLDLPTSMDPQPLQPLDELPSPIDVLTPPTGADESSEPAPEPATPDPGSRPVLEESQEELPQQPEQANLSMFRLQSHVTTEPIPQQELRAGNSHSVLDAHITHVVLEAYASQNERKPFSDGHDLFVRIEPRNADGLYVELPGPISVVVLDRNQTEANARVARWDLTAAETAERIRSNDRGPGIQLELDWPHGAPESDDLYLFVRYTTVDGRKLQTDTRLTRKKDEWSVVPQTQVTSSEAGQWVVVDGSQIETENESATSDAINVATIERASALFQQVADKEAAMSAPQEPARLPAATIPPATPILKKQETATRPKWQPYR